MKEEESDDDEVELLVVVSQPFDEEEMGLPVENEETPSLSLDKDSEISIVEKTRFDSYANPELLSGEK